MSALLTKLDNLATLGFSCKITVLPDVFYPYGFSLQVDEIDGSSLEEVCKSVEGRTRMSSDMADLTTMVEPAMTFKTVESTLQLRSELEDAGEKLVIVEFYAPW